MAKNLLLLSAQAEKMPEPYQEFCRLQVTLIAEILGYISTLNMDYSVMGKD